MLMIHYDDPPDTPLASTIELEAYYEAFKQLTQDFPECWHLCHAAEDRCRAEHLPWLARSMALKTGKTPTWGEVLVAASEDNRYWDREVRHPAIGFLARNKRPQVHSDIPTEVITPTPPRPHTGAPSAKKRRRGGVQQNRGPPPSGPPSGQSGGKGGKAKGKGKQQDHPVKNSQGLYLTDADGRQVCFSWASGQRGGCRNPCPNNRAHVCQHCLQPHRNNACGQRPGNG